MVSLVSLFTYESKSPDLAEVWFTSIDTQNSLQTLAILLLLSNACLRVKF